MSKINLVDRNKLLHLHKQIKNKQIMAKPIFIINLPKGIMIADVQEGIKDTLPDYHVLIVEGTDNVDIEFQCFYEKDMTDIKFDELKEYVTKLIKKQ